MIKRSVLHLLYIILLIPGLVFSQFGRNRSQGQSRYDKRSGSAFRINVWQRPAEGTAPQQTFIFTEVEYSLLQFIKTSSGFTASFDIMLTVTDRDGRNIETTILNKKITVAGYAETIDKQSVYREVHRLSLQPGRYTVTALLDDHASSLPASVSRDITAAPADEGLFTLTEPLLFFAPSEKPDRLPMDSVTIDPVISKKHPHLNAYIEVYTRETDVPLFARFSVSNLREEPVFTDSLNLLVKNKMLRVIVPLPEDLPFGYYTLRMEFSGGGRRRSVQEKFSVRWIQHASMVPELETAVQLMQYLIPKKEFKKLTGMSSKEQQRYIDRYWEENDPAPDTEENPLKEEFYQRSAFSIANFSIKSHEGWQTDRGKIYILFGPPDHIERPVTPVASDHYEIWEYRQLQRKFLFLDSNGNGNYVLHSES